jgi:hypothetical protein
VARQGRGDRLGELIAFKDRPPPSQGDLGPLGAHQGQIRRVLAAPIEPPRRVFVGPAEGAEDRDDRRLRKPLLAEFSDQLRDVIRGDRIEAPACKARRQMLADRVLILHPGRGPQAPNRARQPLLGGITEAKPGVPPLPCAFCSALEQLFAEGAGRPQAALDRPPSLRSAGVPPADFKGAVGAPEDVCLDAAAPRRRV